MGIKESVAHLDPSDIDWTRRADGRRPVAVEPSEVEVFGEPKGRSSAGIDFDKYDAIPVQVTGNAAADIVPISRCAQAGSGKTCAFMVPCIESLLRSGPPASNGGG